MAVKSLTKAAVDKIKPGPTRQEIADAVVPGLYLIVQPTGRKSWAIRYRADGKPKKYTLGRFGVLDLPKARDEARKALERIDLTGMPAAGDATPTASVRRARADTYEAAVSDFIEKHAIARKQNRTAGEQRRLLMTANPDWHDQPVSTITAKQVHHVLDGMVGAGKPYLANKTHDVFRPFWKWLYQRDRVPANIMDKVERPFDRPAPRERVWTDDELAAIWQSADRLGAYQGAFLKLLLLTGQRRGEVAGMRWDEIEMDSAVWRLPTDRAKGKRDHSFPLSSLSLKLLKDIPRMVDNPFVFPGRGTRDGDACPITVGNKIQRRIQDLSGVADFTFHDARRTFRTGLDRLGIPPHIKDECLNHARRSVGDRHYSRYEYLDEQRDAFEAWAGVIRGLPHA